MNGIIKENSTGDLCDGTSDSLLVARKLWLTFLFTLNRQYITIHLIRMGKTNENYRFHLFVVDKNAIGSIVNHGRHGRNNV